MNANSLALFTDSVNQLMECSLLLVDKQIAHLLKSVASIPQLCKVLSQTTKATSYVTEFSRAKVTLTRPDGKSECKLKLPADQNRLFSVVVCLLMEIDGGYRYLLDFLKEFYFDRDSEVSYQMFATEVLKPFKKAGESILKAIDPDSLDDESYQRAERYFSAERIYISTEDMRYMLSLINACKENARNLNNVTNYQRSECVTVCDGLVNALHYKNPKILILSWLAFKNTLYFYDTVISEIVNIEQVINRYISI